MSFTNDDERDGLASLFGGITPQGVPADEPGPRRAAAEPQAESAEPAPAPSSPVYPGLEPSAPVAQQPPAYVAPPSFTPEPPTFGSPSVPAADPGFPPPTYTPPAYTPPAAPPPVYSAPPVSSAPAAPAPGYPAPAAPEPAYTPPSYAAPVEPPAAAPTGPFGEPVAPVYGQPVAPQPGQQQYAPPEPYVPPAYVPPVTPAYDAPAPTYDLPAPAAPPASTAYPGFEPAAPPSAYPGLAPATPGYPPTAQYPAGIDPSAPFGEPTVAPPLAEPEPLAEPPAFGGGFAALGLEPVDAVPVGAPPAETPPDAASYVSEPAVAAAGAAVEAAPARDRSSTVLRRPPGALLPTEHPVIESPEELARATTLEKVGLGVAVIGGPVGLVLAIVTAIRGVRRRGWLIGIGRASIVLAVVSTIAAGIGGVALWNIREAQLAHDEVAAASAEFCAAAAESPQIVEPPLLGWPDPGATITDSLTLMQEWTTRWTDLSAVSPEGLRNGLDMLASNGAEVITAVEQTRLVNDAENKRVISNAASSSGVADWYTTYCVAP